MIRRSAPVPLLLSLAGLSVLAGCAGGSHAPIAVERSPALREAGLERVMGKTASQLAALFGEADLDQREGAARRMQFVGPACVLDAYLIADKAGAEAVVTYLDARLPGGDDIDRASCVAALARRDAAK